MNWMIRDIDNWFSACHKTSVGALRYLMMVQNIGNYCLNQRYYLLILAFLGQNIGLFAQNPVQDNLPPAIDTTASALDTLPPGADSVARMVDLDTINISEDALEARVEYGAQDSMISDITGQRLYLYGNATVKYQDLNMEAAYIMLDLDKSEVLAEYREDSLGNKIGIPAFSQGEQNFTAYRMRYNFETGKGKVYDITTQQDDIVVKGAELKFIRDQDQDTVQNDIFYNKSAIFTTCTAEEPHFGIRSGKQKVINDKLIVVGPSNLEIMGVPTPLVLPFGFFPMKKGRRTGLLFPRDYEYSRQWGFGLRDVGWFFPLGDHINLTLRTDIYLKGTYGVKLNSQYNKRYAYSGNFRFGFDSRRSESTEGIVTRQNSISLSWSHQQAAAAHPLSKFGGSINMQFLGNYQSLVNNEADFVLNNTLNSNFGFTKKWRDKPYNLNVTLSHTQNTRSNLMNVTLPVVRFSTGTLYPFKKKTGGGNEKRWFENIVVRYTGEGRNQLTGQADSFFQARTLETAKVGFRHDVQASTSFKLLKYFSLNPSINYEEVWNFKRVDKRFDPTPTVKIDTLVDDDGVLPDQFVRDTTAYGQVISDTSWAWAPYRQYSFSMGLTTQIFGTLRFRGNGIKGIRHTIKPSISFSYSPNYLNDNLGYFREVQTDSRFPDETRRYSIFEDGVFGSPPQSGEQMSLNFSFRNILEAKYFSKKDSTDKKLKIFDNLNVSGNYNFAADSLNFSQIRLSGATRFFKGTTTLRFNATYDPYAVNENGRRINKFAINESGQLLRFVQANVGIATNLTVSKIRALFQGREEPLDQGIRRGAGGPPDGPPGAAQARREREEDLLSLLENFSISHNISFRWFQNNEQRDTFQITTNSLNLRGSINMTKHWSINVGNIGYDFSRKDITYPSVGFSRDLHCWEMGLNWQPTRGTYSFFIRVKPGTLDFIKLPYQQNNADALRAF